MKTRKPFLLWPALLLLASFPLAALAQPVVKPAGPSVVSGSARFLTNFMGLELAWVKDLPGCERAVWPGGRTGGGWVGRYEVTQGEFTNVLPSNPNPSACKLSNRHPVENITFEDALRFCAELTKRDTNVPPNWHYALPSQAQWEWFAQRMEPGTTNAFFIWPNENHTEPRPVGSLQPNDFGLFDVLGNVAELTTDLQKLPSGEAAHVRRGGGFQSPRAVLSAKHKPNPDANWLFQPPDLDTGLRVLLVPSAPGSP